MFEKRENIQLDLQENHQQRDDREAKSRILRRVAESQGLDLMQGSNPPPKRKEKKTLHIERKPVM
jgi:hypothetical protein